MVDTCIGVADEAMAEIIVPDKTGLLVLSENVEALATALTHLLGNRQLCQKMGEQARRPG